MLPAGPPTPEIVARVGALHLQLPVSQARVTAIGYQGGSEGSLALVPLGTQANQGLLKRLCTRSSAARAPGRAGTSCPAASARRPRRSTSARPPGTDVYSPVDGTVVAIEPGRPRTAAPRLAHRHPAVGAHRRSSCRSRTCAPTRRSRSARRSTAGGSRLGSIVDFAHAERQALARYTNDAGNHVVVEVHPSASLALG